MRIKKIESVTATNGTIVDSLNGSSTTDAPSINAVNNKFNENKNESIKTATYIYSGFENNHEAITNKNIEFTTMFPTLTYDDIICFNIEITNVEITWFNTYANILGGEAQNKGQLQIRSQTSQTIEVRITAFYK